MISAIVSVPFIAEAVDTPTKLENTAVNFWADPENRITEDDLTAYSQGDKTAMVGAVGAYARSTSSNLRRTKRTHRANGNAATTQLRVTDTIIRL